MKITQSASEKSLHELRGLVKKSLLRRDDVLMGIIDALTVGPRIETPSELAVSPMLGYECLSVYTGIRKGVAEGSIERLRDARIEWLEERQEEVKQTDPRLEGWRVRILDATNYDRPKTQTVKLGFTHGVEGMKPGHTLSVLSEVVGEGSWCLPLEEAVVGVGETPCKYGREQVVRFKQRHGWNSNDVLVVDAAYTNAPTLQPMVEAGVNVLGRVSSKRNFYLPPPEYSGRGRPRVRGRKLRLSDSRTLPKEDEHQRIELDDGRYYEISRWTDVRMHKWPEQALVLYRIIEYRANGERRFKRPLWLIYVTASEQMPIPSPYQGQAIYENRFSIEHSLRFKKGQLGLDAGQFNGKNADQRVQLWVELVATAMWMLFALRGVASSTDIKWPPWWRSRRLTPGAIRRLAMALFVTLGIGVFRPQVHGKSPGRLPGTKMEPRKRYRIFRKRKVRSAA